MPAYTPSEIHSLFRHAQRGRMKLETRAVIELPEGLAVLHGSWIVEPSPGIGDVVATQGVSTEVIRKQADGTWLFVVDNPHTPE
jgi:ketosteroid isomerase-like protein